MRFLEIYADPRIENSEALMTKMHEFITSLANNLEFWAAIAEFRENSQAIDAHTHGERTLKRRLIHEVDQTLYNFRSREDGINSVTDGEIRSFLQKYFVERNLVTMFYGPKEHIIEILEKNWPEVEIHVLTTESTIE